MDRRGSKRDTFEDDVSLCPRDPYDVQTQAPLVRDETEPGLFRGTSYKGKAPSSDVRGGNRLTYMGGDFNDQPNRSGKHLEESQDAPLVHNVVDVGHTGNYQDLGLSSRVHKCLTLSYCGLEYSDPYDAIRERPTEKSSRFAQLLSSGKYPLEQRIEDKKRGIGRQNYPFVGTPLLLFWKHRAEQHFSMGTDCYYDWSVYIRTNCQL
jgi:hypothetical protein